MPRNILFIMCDQLRWDYLSCYGHPHLETPHIDGLAKRGIRFDRAYVQSPVCGPSRMSTYTGRTVFSHGATWNFVPLPIGEHTIGDLLRPHGVRVGIAGKTHIIGDKDGLARLGVNPESEIGLFIREGGFEPFERDDGIHPDGIIARTGAQPAYNDWLRDKGYVSDNPWHDFANSAEGPNGEILSGWALRNCHLPARVSEEHSETAYITDRGIEFIKDSGDRRWLLHLSYIKPHWPYMAPAPYHNMYGHNTFLPPIRSDSERVAPHPVYRAFMNMEVSQSFSREEVRNRVLGPYMGMIRQIDYHVGRVITHLEETGLIDDTMIVFTSDHGDYLGDHWLGEKELFHEQSVRVPLIIVDPSSAADSTRGEVSSELVEAIDLVPTFLEYNGCTIPSHRLEGRSLMPILRGEKRAPHRGSVFSELDYGFYHARAELGVSPQDARCYMIRTNRWKYVHYKSFRPQLFDLENDGYEFEDLGDSPGHGPVLSELRAMLMDRLLERRNRVTMDDEEVIRRGLEVESTGVLIGRW